MLFLPMSSGAQKPIEVSSEVLQALQHFGEKQDAGAANGFFALLFQEQFTDEKIQFPALSPQNTLKAHVWYWAAEYYYAAGRYQETEHYALQALPLLKKGNDETTLADCLNVLAINSVRQGRYPEAIGYARQVYDLDMESGDEERISMSLNTLAGLYISARQPQEAEKYVVKGLEMARRSGLEHRQAIVEGMAAEMYHALGRDTLATDYAEAAYKKEVHLGRPHKAMIRLSQKAAALLGLKRYGEAEKALTTAIDYFREHGGQQQSLAISLNQRGKARLALALNADGTGATKSQLTEQAKADFREAAELLAEMGDRYGEMHARQGLYECLYQTEPDSARLEMDRFLLLRDSLYDMASAESLARYNAEFGNDFLQEEITAERSARQRIVTGIVVGVVLLCMAIVVLLRYMRRYRRKQQQRMRQLMELIETNREKTAPEASAEQNGQQEQPQQEERQELSAANAEFLSNTNAVIHQLMPDGQVDTARVASELCLSTSQFRRRISAVTGLTAANYILMIRMDEAKQLLDQYPKYTMSEIAQRCGFADSAHFTHAFKRIFSITPSEYTKA